MNTIANIEMYKTDGKRVIVFSGILHGKMAAYEGTKAWAEAFELARQLNVQIKPIYGYTGSLAK
jgi:hypothetical protein